MKIFARHDKSTFTPAEMAEMLIDPYEKTPKYAKAAVIFLCSGIALFGLINLACRYGSRLAKTKRFRRCVAFYRWIATSQPRATRFASFPTVGTILLIVVFWLFIAIWTFAQTPYYRSRWNVGSPPLAMRTGLFALGCFPFILAFGSKWNVYHQWLSHLFLILSLLHTFPFVVQGTHEIRPNTDGLNPHGYSQLYYSWHVSHKVTDVFPLRFRSSGIAALVPLAVLCWGSFAFIRNRSYELFKYLHIVSAVLFSAFFYIHCNALLTSWHYLWATAAVYLTALLVRLCLILVRNGRLCLSLVRNGRRLPLAHLEALPDHAIRATISLPAGAGIRWTAGQHYFVNFLKASAWESHPYTVANAPWIDPSSSASPSTMILLLRVSPLTGLGPRLLHLASSSSSSSPTTQVLLDGPYGGPSSSSIEFGRHEKVVLIAGGAGMSFVVAVVEELCGRMEAKEWFDEQVERAIRFVEDKVELHLYVTGSSLGDDVVDAKVEEVEDDKGSSGSPSSAPWVTHHHRPSLPALLASAFDSARPNSSIGIGSCGPTSLTEEVRRVVASRQREIAFGKSGKGVGEIELWTEEFGW
ncbi:hypothetical protein JCM5296_005529 [Sporobolomyces johnsonii]